MTTKVQKWGNSLAVRLPKALAESAHMTAGTNVMFVRKPGGFEVQSAPKIIAKKYTLQELLKGMTKKNIHPETDWGKPMGKEIW